MFATERLNIIKSYLREHHRLDVHTVAELLNVSEVTIRRDLEKLESEGFLTRIHGGAIPVEQEPAGVEPGLDPAGNRQLDEIAMLAAMMVRDGDVVAVLNGSIMPFLARRLSDKSNVTVLTNHMPVAMEISRQPANKAVLLGGSVDGEEQAVFGSLTLANLRNYFVNHLFVEIDGISDQLQLTVRSQEKADLIRESMACATTTTALCLPGNFGRNAFFRLGGALSMGRVVSSPQVDDTFKDRFFNSGIPLFTSINAYEGAER